MKKYQAIILVTLMFLFTIYVVSDDKMKSRLIPWNNGATDGATVPPVEKLTVSKDRATDLYNWFIVNSSPTYETYLNEFDGNAVEYDDLLRLHKSGKMTKESINNIITY